MKVYILLFLTFSFLYSNTTVSLEKGWKLIGMHTQLSNMEIFNNSKVDIVWSYNALEQKWEGYSSSVEIVKKIGDKNISILSSLEPYQAVWIHSSEDWDFELEKKSSTIALNDEIVLKKGWNLISLPNKTIVDKDFFGNAVVWKYSEEWSVNDKTLAFPTISNIKESDALWVNVAEDRTIDMGEEVSRLRTFESESEMLDFLRNSIKSNNYRNNYFYGDYSLEENFTMDTDDDSAEVSVVSAEKSADATTTNLQESGVDESDILKHDGTYIFTLDRAEKEVFITSFENIASNSYDAINKIKMGDEYVISMYLQSNRLIILSDSPSKISIFDVSDIKNIHELSTHTIDGYYEESRLVDGKLFIVTRFRSQIEYSYNKKYATGVCSTLDINEISMSCISSVSAGSDKEDYVKEESCKKGTDYDVYHSNKCYSYNYSTDGTIWKYDYENPVVLKENLTPTITSNNVSSELVVPNKFFASKKLDQQALITTISSIDILSGEYIESISILGNTDKYYASTTSFYLVSNSYPQYFNFFDYKSREMIYKFSLEDKLLYKGRGFVEGTMLNQFSMSEKDGYLRVATTQGNSWSGTGTDNSIYTLKESNETLQVTGVLNGLGKENETIKAVRFMGDRGYVVTFEQTDPLYTIDISDPKNPKKVGELSIPGYSSYLHIVDENRVLSVGRDADESGRVLDLQLQLFDVTNFSNPQLVDKVQIKNLEGNGYVYSEAENNHKAFVYRSSDLMFGIPYTVRNYYASEEATENFAIYQVDGMKINSIEIISNKLDYYDYKNMQRGLIFDLNSTTYGALFKGSSITSKTIDEEK